MNIIVRVADSPFFFNHSAIHAKTQQCACPHYAADRACFLRGCELGRFRSTCVTVFYSARIGAFVLSDYKDPGLWVAIGSVFTGLALFGGGLCSGGDRPGRD